MNIVDIMSVGLGIGASVTSIFSMVSMVLNIKKNNQLNKHTTDLKDIVLKNAEKQNKVVIEKALDNMPNGVDQEKFFEQLKKELNNFSSVTPDSLVENNTLNELLKEHHRQALEHASVQFWLSIFMSLIGFFYMIIMITTISNVQWYEYILKALPGTIIEVVSVLFINQARETRERATEFFKELNYEKQIERSVGITDTIENKDIQASVKSKIALHIIGINDEKKKD